jgi:alkylation response protein AidB-like acyl-CoA dehydrogenase
MESGMITLTDTQKAIIETVRDFVERDVVPVADEMEHNDEFPDAIVEQMKELGLFGLNVPEQYGGIGENLTTYALSVVELARGWMSLSGILNTHFMGNYLIGKFGTDEQRDKYLPLMATGELRAALAMSEPEAGSDVQAIRTKAVRDGDQYVLNGQKNRDDAREDGSRRRPAPQGHEHADRRKGTRRAEAGAGPGRRQEHREDGL